MDLLHRSASRGLRRDDDHAERRVWGEHWARMQRLHPEGRLILVGPTLGPYNTGICVFEAPDQAAVQAFMEEDPAIASGIGRGELRAFRVSLLRGRDQRAWS